MDCEVMKGNSKETLNMLQQHGVETFLYKTYIRFHSIALGKRTFRLSGLCRVF